MCLFLYLGIIYYDISYIFTKKISIYLICKLISIEVYDKMYDNIHFFVPTYIYVVDYVYEL